MALSKDLVSQFVKTTNDDDVKKSESIVYGTICVDTSSGDSEAKYVKLDGSDTLIPVVTTQNTTVEVGNNDRVTVMIKDHQAIVTGNLTSPSTTIIAVEGVYENISATYATIEELNLAKGRITTLETDTAEIEDLVAEKATIDALDTQTARIDTLSSGLVAVNTMVASKASAEELDAAEANIANLQAADVTITNNLNAAVATIDDLEADVAKIDTLIFGSASGDVIQTEFSNAVIAQVGDAQIKSAMIESISADKITAGDIITNNVRVKSEDGSLIISDETLQISDGSQVRVQIGEDDSGDYSINVWDQNGNLMFSEGGITDSAIKDKIIRNDMVSDTANIHASKLDIDSLFEEINGSTNTIKSTQIYLDDESQTLDAAFKTLETTITDQGETISSHTTSISAIQGEIATKVTQQEIDTAIDGVESDITTLSTKYSTLEQDLNGFQTTVSETYATIEEVDTAQSSADEAGAVASNAETLIKQLSDSISMLVTDGNGSSLMTQTDNGWTFSTSDIQNSVNDISETLNSLTTEIGDAGNTINILEQAVNDLGIIADYIKITTYEDEPCIELGEGDSDFKLRITNTRMMFTEGSTILAYFNNQSFCSKKVVIEEELHQGGYVWKTRTNGNLGLVWEGVINNGNSY